MAWTGWTPDAPELRIAHAELIRLDSERTLLARVAVVPGCRGHDFGKHLLEATLKEASRLRIGSVELNVYADNRPAVQLYRAMGFEERATDAGRQDFLRMERSLR